MIRKRREVPGASRPGPEVLERRAGATRVRVVAKWRAVHSRPRPLHRELPRSTPIRAGLSSSSHTSCRPIRGLVGSRASVRRYRKTGHGQAQRSCPPESTRPYLDRANRSSFRTSGLDRGPRSLQRTGGYAECEAGALLELRRILPVLFDVPGGWLGSVVRAHVEVEAGLCLGTSRPRVDLALWAWVIARDTLIGSSRGLPG